jgi:hypothetical protein
MVSGATDFARRPGKLLIAEFLRRRVVHSFALEPDTDGALIAGFNR